MIRYQHPPNKTLKQEISKSEYLELLEITEKYPINPQGINKTITSFTDDNMIDYWEHKHIINKMKEFEGKKITYRHF